MRARTFDVGSSAKHRLDCILVSICCSEYPGKELRIVNLPIAILVDELQKLVNFLVCPGTLITILQNMFEFLMGYTPITIQVKAPKYTTSLHHVSLPNPFICTN